MELIKPVKKNEELMAEMDRCLLRTDGHFQLWWLGQSGYLIQWKQHRILLDPYLSDSLTKKYAGTDKPHVRISEQVIGPEVLKNISVVSSSHNHTDHLDAETLMPILSNNPNATLIVPRANLSFASSKLSVPIERLTPINEEDPILSGMVIYSGIPAAHNEIERDANGDCKCMGYVIQFGTWTIYHSGDTLYYEGMEDLLKPFKIDLALLPINGNDPSRKVAGNLNAMEAVALAKAIGARHVIPCHYHLFEFNTVEPDEFAKLAQQAAQAHTILQLGGNFESINL